MNILKNSLCILLFGVSSSAAPAALEQVGKALRLPFPNEQLILGVGGLGYNADADIWTASSENIAPVKGAPEAIVSLPKSTNRSV